MEQYAQSDQEHPTAADEDCSVPSLSLGKRPNDRGDANQERSQADPGEINPPQRHVLHLEFNAFPRRENRQAQLQRRRRSRLGQRHRSGRNGYEHSSRQTDQTQRTQPSRSTARPSSNTGQ